MLGVQSGSELGVRSSCLRSEPEVGEQSVMFAAPTIKEGSSMRSLMRSRLLLAAVVCVLSMAGAAPAVADSGGVPHGSPDTCGVGKEEAHELIANPESPGASEIKQFPPNE